MGKRKERAASPAGRTWTAPLIVFVAALAVRLAYLWSVAGTPVLELPVNDAEHYWEWAGRIAAGEDSGGVFFMAPFYPYLLAGLRKLAGPTLWAPLLLQAAAGAALCLLVERISKRFFGAAPALIAGLWAAFYGPLVFHDGALMKEGWIALLNMGALALLLGAEGDERPPMRASLGAGLLIGCSALCRPNIFLWLPLLAWWAWRVWRKRAWIPALVLAAGIAVLIFPVAVRNRAAGGRWVITVASGGMNLWTGNNPMANGTYYGAPFVTSQVPEMEAEDFRAEASRRLGREVSLTESSAYWRSEALRFIVRRPGRALAVLWKKWSCFWSSWEIPSNLNYYVAEEHSSVLRLLFLGFGWLGPLSALGIALAWRRWGTDLLLPSTLLLVQAATNMIFFTHAAYRIAAVPILFVFTAGAIRRLSDAVTERRGRALAVSAAALILAGWFCNRALPEIERLSVKEMQYYTFGVLYEDRERYPEAEAMYLKALERNPRVAMVLQSLSGLYDKMGKPDRARTIAARALSAPKRVPAAGTPLEMPRSELAARMFLGKRYLEAERLFGELAKGEPEQAHAHLNNRGLARLRMRKLEPALSDFRTAVRLKPDYAPARYNLGLALLVQGKKAAAAGEFREALRLEPGHAKARDKLERLGGKR